MGTLGLKGKFFIKHKNRIRGQRSTLHWKDINPLQ